MEHCRNSTGSFRYFDVFLAVFLFILLIFGVDFVRCAFRPLNMRQAHSPIYYRTYVIYMLVWHSFTLSQGPYRVRLSK